MKIFGTPAPNPKQNEAGQWVFSFRPKNGGADIPCMTHEQCSGPSPCAGSPAAIEGDWLGWQLFIVQMISLP
jgi:hypothetical protein